MCVLAVHRDGARPWPMLTPFLLDPCPPTNSYRLQGKTQECYLDKYGYRLTSGAPNAGRTSGNPPPGSAGFSCPPPATC